MDKCKSRNEIFLNAIATGVTVGLPMPISRVETFLNAIATGNINNLPIPNSRNEVFLNAIATGNINNLPIPNSRIEKILNSIAKEEDNPIEIPLSRFEEYLCAIKGGTSKKYTSLDISKIIKGYPFELEHDEIDLTNETIFVNVSKSDIVALSNGESISLTMLATVASLAVAYGLTIKDDNNLYDFARDFVSWCGDSYNDVVKTFEENVVLTSMGVVSVGSAFLNYFDSFLEYNISRLPSVDSSVPVDYDYVLTNGIPHYKNYSKNYFELNVDIKPSTALNSESFTYSVSDSGVKSILFSNGKKYTFSTNSWYSKYNFFGLYITGSNYVYALLSPDGLGYAHIYIGTTTTFGLNSSISLPNSFNGVYDNKDVLDNKKEDGSIGLLVPGDLSNLSSMGSSDIIYDGTNAVTYDGTLSIPQVSSPSVLICEPYSFKFVATISYKNILSIRESATINNLTLSILNNELKHIFINNKAKVEGNNIINESNIKIALNKNGLYINGIKCNTEDSIGILEELSNSNALKIGAEGEIANNIDYNSVIIYHSLKTDKELSELTLV